MNDNHSDELEKFEDYYMILGIRPEADALEIRKAYIVKAKSQHPDAGGSIDAMRQLNRAYKTLKDSASKAGYDLLHSFHTGITKPSDYHYSDGRKVNDITDMTDDEIDGFLDNLLFDEYRHGVPQTKTGMQKWIDKLKRHKRTV